MVRTHTKGNELVCSVVTQFSTNFIALQCLVIQKVKTSFERDVCGLWVGTGIQIEKLHMFWEGCWGSFYIFWATRTNPTEDDSEKLIMDYFSMKPWTVPWRPFEPPVKGMRPNICHSCRSLYTSGQIRAALYMTVILCWRSGQHSAWLWRK